MDRPAGGCITGSVPPVSVLLAVREPLQQAMLARALCRREDLVLAGTEPDGARALEAILRRAPDVAVIDVDLPAIGGLEVCRRLATTGRDVATRILLLDGHPAVTHEVAVSVGAAGCLPATAPSVQLCDAVASIAGGGTVFRG